MKTFEDIKYECENRNSCKGCVFFMKGKQCMFNAIPKEWNTEGIEKAVKRMYERKGILSIHIEKPKE